MREIKELIRHEKQKNMFTRFRVSDDPQEGMYCTRRTRTSQTRVSHNIKNPMEFSNIGVYCISNKKAVNDTVGPLSDDNGPLANQR